jgi:hypothetical protein
MTNRYAFLCQGFLKAEGTPKEKRDKVVAPVFAYVSQFVGQLALLIDEVTGQVSPQVRSWSGVSRFRTTRLNYLQNEAWARVPLAKQEEVKGQVAG